MGPESPRDEEWYLGGPGRVGREKEVAHPGAVGSPLQGRQGARTDPSRVGGVQRAASCRSATSATEGHRLRPTATPCPREGAERRQVANPPDVLGDVEGPSKLLESRGPKR